MFLYNKCLIKLSGVTRVFHTILSNINGKSSAGAICQTMIKSSFSQGAMVRVITKLGGKNRVYFPV